MAMTVPKGGEPSLILQKVGMWCIIVSILCEYVFLIINIIYIVKTLIKQRKDPKKAKKENIADYMVYKWVRNQDLTTEN
jgi:hypothetical protein